MLRTKKHLVGTGLFLILALLAFATLPGALAAKNESKEEGQWLPTGDDSACATQEVCVEWCLMSSGPTGVTCCIHKSKVGSNKFNDCAQFRS